MMRRFSSVIAPAFFLLLPSSSYASSQRVGANAIPKDAHVIFDSLEAPKSAPLLSARFSTKQNEILSNLKSSQLRCSDASAKINGIIPQMANAAIGSPEWNKLKALVVTEYENCLPYASSVDAAVMFYDMVMATGDQSDKSLASQHHNVLISENLSRSRMFNNAFYRLLNGK